MKVHESHSQCVGFAQGSPEILLELETTESQKVCLYVMTHNSVLVVCINLSARALLAGVAQTPAPIAEVGNNLLESAGSGYFRIRVFWSIIICMRIVFNPLISFLTGCEDTSLAALCNAGRWLHLPAHSDWFCWAPVHCRGHCDSPAR